VELHIQGWVFHERAPTQYLNGTYPNVESFHVNIRLPNPLLSCDSFQACFYEIYLPTIVTHFLPSNSVRLHVFGTILWPTIDIPLVDHHLNSEPVAYHGITTYRLEAFLTHYLKCDSPNISSGLINNPHWELNLIHGGWKSSSHSVPQEPFWFTPFPIVVPHKCSPPRTCSQWPFPDVRNCHCECNKPKGQLQLNIDIFFFNTMLWTPGEHGDGMSIQNNLGYDQEGIESFLGFRSLDQTQVCMCYKMEHFWPWWEGIAMLVLVQHCQQ